VTGVALLGVARLTPLAVPAVRPEFAQEGPFVDAVSKRDAVAGDRAQDASIAQA